MTMNDGLAEALADVGVQRVETRQPTWRQAMEAVSANARLVEQIELLRARNEVLEAENKRLRAGLAPNTLTALAHKFALKGRITTQDLRGKKRHPRIVLVRDAFCWAAYHHMGCSYPEIGQFLDRHHTTVLAAVGRHQARLDAGEAS